MKQETFIKLCGKALEKDNMTFGVFSPELCTYMVHKPYNKTPFANFCFKYNDFKFCFLIYLTTKGGLLEEPTYVVYLSVLADTVEVDHFTGFNPEEINLVLELYKRKEQQLEEALKEFLES